MHSRFHTPLPLLSECAPPTGATLSGKPGAGNAERPRFLSCQILRHAFVDNVTTWGYILIMRKNKAAASPSSTKRAVLSVREAKAHFSSLIRRAAKGEETTITWHGQARARISAVRADGDGFHIDREWLKSMPDRRRGALAEELVRADRDSRG